jgi:Zn finger protein HypA/HybF involved in hydrogenase expression
MASEIFQCWSCKSVLHSDELDGVDCPLCCTDDNLIDIDELPEDREDR